jgi:hypothetical protein
MADTKNSLVGTELTSDWTGRALPSERVGVRIFHVVWYSVNILLIFAFIFAIYAVGWEYSTRRYLKGFSDAIVPATAPGDEKVQAILDWMSHGPARMPNGPSPLIPDRNPTDTLNYDALLQVCGTATNAFINLLDTGHMDVRRLLLLDSDQRTKHVVAEVLVDGRWIIVDPAYRIVLRDAHGKTLTREELTDPATFAAATKDIPRYDATYTFDHTVHLRVARLHLFGAPLRTILDRWLPGWEDSTAMTLLVERESYAAVVTAVLLVILLLLIRVSLRWYGEKRMNLRLLHAHSQLQRSLIAFFTP